MSNQRAAWPRCVLLALLAAFISPHQADAETKGQTVLDAYVARPEPAYSWKIVASQQTAAGRVDVVDLTTLEWLTADQIDRPLWRHWMTIVRPPAPRSTTALLIITGGDNGRPAPEGPSRRASQLARQTGAVVVELGQVPNQPLAFTDDQQPRKEDDLIARAGDKFVRTGDPRWVTRLPMVKSAVQAMNAVQEIVAADDAAGPPVEKFIVAGASKRGWTTWLTGAVDSRVSAVIPLVIDCLNVVESMPHHLASYGFWAPAIGDYENHGLLDRLNQPAYRELLKIDDPYYYRDRLEAPKYIVNSAGDQYFLPDSSQFYFDQLVGEKHLRYVPNTDHSLDGSDALESAAAFSRLILQGEARPNYRWEFREDGSIAVECGDEPAAVRLWQAHNPAARDFRLETLGPVYEATSLTPGPDGAYLAKAPTPQEGWTAYFVELEYATEAGLALKFTTGVRVAPDRLPHVGLLEQRRAAPPN